MIIPTNPKRPSKKRPTPIIDDEVRGSARLNYQPDFEHMYLDDRSKPRKLNKKDTSMMQKRLQQALEEVVVAGKEISSQSEQVEQETNALSVSFMQNLAITYYEVNPEDVTEDKLKFQPKR